MTPDYSAALIDARKQLDAAEKAAALHDWALAIASVHRARDHLINIGASLAELQQNAQRAM